MVDAKSHGTMFIISNEYLYERRVIEAKIASCNHNYEEQQIAGTLPDATNEAMYEMRTGCYPFWLKDEDNSKIVDFAEYLKRKKEKQNE